MARLPAGWAGDIVGRAVEKGPLAPPPKMGALRLAATLGTAAGVLSLLVAFVAALLGGLALFISRKRTGLEGIGVLAVAFFQLITVIFGGFILPAGLIAMRHPLGWIGRIANAAVFAVTVVLLLVSFGRR
jgi:hypothetical protein